MDSKLPTVFLVDDDDVDARAIVRTFKKHGIPYPVVRARDGMEGLELLQQGRDSGVKRPFIILLDINMPRMDGIEFLAALRADPELRSSIVFVLTTSNDDQDKWAAYEQIIAGYIVKTGSGEGFEGLSSLVDQYLATVELPPLTDRRKPV